jgi:hypothetical protein
MKKPKDIPSKMPAELMDFFRAAGREGGLKSAEARMKKLTPATRKAIAKKAAARWGKAKETN